jgi:cob(I)alamin adenosyltransferase
MKPFRRPLRQGEGTALELPERNGASEAVARAVQVQRAERRIVPVTAIEPSSSPSFLLYRAKKSSAVNVMLRAA